MEKISVVVPVYRNQDTITELVERVLSSIQSTNCNAEIILVNDNSPDNSWDVIQKLCKEHPEVKGIAMARNFGQHFAISAGIDYATGDWLVVMDADLQDSPEEIPNFYKLAKDKKVHCILAQRIDRNDSFFKKLSSKLFYKFFNFLVGTNADFTVGNFGIYSSRIYNYIKEMPESNRFFPLQVQWIGFEFAKLPVTHSARKSGKSSYNYPRLIKMALKIIINHTNRPLYFAIILGAISLIIAILLGGYFFLNALISHNQEVMGWSSLIVSIYFFSGVILFSIGLMGIYIGNTFTEVKRRPPYFIREVI